MRIKKGDQVKIMSGKDRGKSGKVLDVFPGLSKLVVEGLNVFKKRVKPRQQGQQGETISVSRAMPASKVMLVCPSCKEATRIGMKIETDGKVRICRKCKAIL